MRKFRGVVPSKPITTNLRTKMFGREVNQIIAASKVKYYTVFDRTMLCAIELPNNHIVVGVASFPPTRRFDAKDCAEIAQILAMEDARRQIWTLEAFLSKRRYRKLAGEGDNDESTDDQLDDDEDE